MNYNIPSQSGPQPPVDIHEPFTTAERIEQLSNIDNDIASLLRHTSSALRCIAKPPSQPSPASSSSEVEEPSTEAAITEFKEIQSDFLDTLDRVDKHLKRQIWALEEAGIITLRPSDPAGGEEETAPGGVSMTASMDSGRPDFLKKVVARLEPDGVGRYGQLDVGQLNMASSTVERDMEGELWGRTREQLAAAGARKEGEGSGHGADRMQE